ncbi:DUF547 domain-containing protein [Ulvibacter litoralis]|uniref:DUF547 domain-containing protein n=1 Tax=Ulvibacter litoralis TaxID=227084 RepID=A0A1G7CAT0_9FLAO|nr:DUF547 domain-containing protein [Ulvibacter litoralis]SDE36437.1 Protein of unknown function, DUF547 [Ulvibacter litoralis]
MRKYILILLFMPFISCAESGNSIPDLAYSSNLEISDNVATISHQKWDDLLQKHVSSSGKVDYLGFKNDTAALQSYLDVLAENLPKKSWSKNATLAYWINAYNAFTVKLILDNYPVESIKDIKKPWDQDFIMLENSAYSLGEIEHKILRKMNEPRIHFAINCASYSCPNLLNEAYTEAKIEKQLESSTISFINDTTKNSITADKIEISKIFDWFSGDFKNEGSLIDFLNKYSTVKINANTKINYKDYKWNLNN